MKEYLFVLAGMLLSFFAPAVPIIGALVFVAAVDHILGVWKAVKKKEKLSLWLGVWGTISKVIIYGLIILAVLAIDRTVLNEIVKLVLGKLETSFIATKIAALALFAKELVSINQHYKTVKGVSLLSALFATLGKAKKVADEVGKIKSGAAILIVISTLIYGCRSGEELYNAAVKKGVKCEPVKEIHFKTVYDTIKDEKTNTIYLVKKQQATDTIYRESVVKIPMSRQERKAYSDSLSFERFKFKKLTDLVEAIETNRDREAGKTERVAIRNEEPTFKEIAGKALGYFLAFIVMVVISFLFYLSWKAWKKGRK